MLVIAAVVSFLATWLSEMQIIGLISAKKLVRTFYKFVESGSDLTDFDYSVDSAIFKLVTDNYFKKSRFQLFIHSFIVIAVITTGYFLGKSIFWGCIIGVIASTSLALSKELDLRYEFLADIKMHQTIIRQRTRNVEQKALLATITVASVVLRYQKIVLFVTSAVKK